MTDKPDDILGRKNIGRKDVELPDIEESLDPKNWDEMRELGHRMVDDAINYLQSVGERPVWQAVPEQTAEHFEDAMPQHGTRPEKVYEEFLDDIYGYPMGNIHPRFWAWYMGSGTIVGAMGDFLAATMNSNLGAGNHVANMVESQVVNWMKEIVGYPKSAGGLLLSGASMANLIGLTVARNTQPDFDVRKHGLVHGGKRLVVYGSTEIHACNQKAVELLGMGGDSLHRVPVTDDYRLDMHALEQQIKKDRADDLLPICVIATSGTVNTGAIDPLNDIADFCEREGLWFHVDGAIGAVAMLADNLKKQFSGIERADSIAMDLHKSMHVPFEAGCALVRDKEKHRNAFALSSKYLVREERGLGAGREWFSEYGVELSRGFRALKVWMAIKEHGAQRYGKMIEQSVKQAQYLASLIEAQTDLYLMTPVGLDIVCFRYQPGDLIEEKIAALNKEILIRLQEDGIAAISYTTLRGKYCLRVAIANHRSRKSDFDLLVDEIIKLGAELVERS
jgi:glutamate/tyrosine decarboxylase-like PLP-dependent enzyme